MRNNRRVPVVSWWPCDICCDSAELHPSIPARGLGQRELCPLAGMRAHPTGLLLAAALTQCKMFANPAGIWRLIYLKWLRTTSGLKFPLCTNFP